MFSSYDNWKTTDPRDLEPYLEEDQVCCPFCDGEGAGRDEDGPWSCSYCRGSGIMELEELRIYEAEETPDVCSRCGCEPCDCENIEAMMAGKEAA